MRFLQRSGFFCGFWIIIQYSLLLGSSSYIFIDLCWQLGLAATSLVMTAPVSHINEVNVCSARLVLRSVTVCGHTLLVCN